MRFSGGSIACAIILGHKVIRSAGVDDEPWISSLIDEARSLAEVWPGRWDRRMVTEAIQQRRCLVVDVGTIAGFLIYRPPGEAWEVDLVAVSPARRGRGIFRKLLAGLLQVATRQAGDDGQVYPVWLEVHEANTAATAAYLRCGFREVGRRPGYYADGGAAILMTRDCL